MICQLEIQVLITCVLLVARDLNINVVEVSLSFILHRLDDLFQGLCVHVARDLTILGCLQRLLGMLQPSFEGDLEIHLGQEGIVAVVLFDKSIVDVPIV